MSIHFYEVLYCEDKVHTTATEKLLMADKDRKERSYLPSN